jgi:hypothetical protein
MRSGMMQDIFAFSSLPPMVTALPDVELTCDQKERVHFTNRLGLKLLILFHKPEVVTCIVCYMIHYCRLPVPVMLIFFSVKEFFNSVEHICQFKAISKGKLTLVCMQTGTGTGTGSIRIK